MRRTERYIQTNEIIRKYDINFWMLLYSPKRMMKIMVKKIPVYFQYHGEFDVCSYIILLVFISIFIIRFVFEFIFEFVS